MDETKDESIINHGAIDLVCLDLGGVLIRICRSLEEALSKAEVQLRPPPGSSDGSFERLDENNDWRQLHHDYETGRCDVDRYFRQASAMTGATVAQTEAILKAWLHDPYPGVIGLIDQLTNKDAKADTACLSNTNAYHWSMMTQDGPTHLPLDRLDLRFTSFQIGAAKPDGEIYAHVERVTGVAPGRIIFFDDHRPNVTAAAQRGWQAHLIDPDDDTVGQINRQLTGCGVI